MPTLFFDCPQLSEKARCVATGLLVSGRGVAPGRGASAVESGYLRVDGSDNRNFYYVRADGAVLRKGTSADNAEELVDGFTRRMEVIGARERQRAAREPAISSPLAQVCA